MLKRTIFSVSLVLGVSLLVGCCCHRSYPPMLPVGWNVNECDEKSLEDNPKQARLHVLVMYHGMSCTHTALRLYSRTKGPLFWDPAGSFAKRKRYVGPAARHNKDFAAPPYMESVRLDDVITEEVPGINRYLTWRKLINTHTVEIFEFNISDAEADELWTVLRYGTKRSHPKGAFGTHSIGFTCGLVVAKFLHRFAEDIVEVDTVFFPHNLAKQLYKGNPDRVVVYLEDRLYYYIPSDCHAE